MKTEYNNDTDELEVFEEVRRIYPTDLCGEVVETMKLLRALKKAYGDNVVMDIADDYWGEDGLLSFVVYRVRPETDAEADERIRKKHEAAVIAREEMLKWREKFEKTTVENVWYFDENGKLLPGQENAEEAEQALKQITAKR